MVRVSAWQHRNGVGRPRLPVRAGNCAAQYRCDSLAAAQSAGEAGSCLWMIATPAPQLGPCSPGARRLRLIARPRAAAARSRVSGRGNPGGLLPLRHSLSHRERNVGPVRSGDHHPGPSSSRRRRYRVDHPPAHGPAIPGERSSCDAPPRLGSAWLRPPRRESLGLPVVYRPRAASATTDSVAMCAPLRPTSPCSQAGRPCRHPHPPVGSGRSRPVGQGSPTAMDRDSGRRPPHRWALRTRSSWSTEIAAIARTCGQWVAVRGRAAHGSAAETHSRDVDRQLRRAR